MFSNFKDPARAKIEAREDHESDLPLAGLLESFCILHSAYATEHLPADG
jgi:hypothetical protein